MNKRSSKDLCIFCQTMGGENKNKLISRLWDKKVPQYLGTYFAVGFGLLQFVEFVTKRYTLNGNLVDKYLLVWLALIPAIVTLVYFGGKLRPSTTSGVLKWPKFLIIGNVVIAFFLGGFLFNGNAAEQGEVVELTNEEGKKVVALVPALKKVKTIASFQFENTTGDKGKDWWGIAFSQLLQLNLEQRPDYYASSVYVLNGYFAILDLKLFTVPNVGMQRKIAQKSRSDYFSRISYAIVDGQFVFRGNLYSSRDGKSVLGIDLKDKDPYAAIDKIKQQIYDELPNMIEDAPSNVNLPASTLITNNVEALKYLTESRIAFYNNPTGLDEVVELAKKAVELDPTCAVCHFWVGDPLYGLGQRDESITYIKNAVKYGTSLPTRMQFRPKAVLYSITGKLDSYWKLQELRRKMFPYEFEPYERLLSMYKTNYGVDSAKVLVKEAITNGNLEKGLLALYDLQLENEDFDEAKTTLDRFSSEFPDRDQAKIKYANIFEKQGKIAEAKKILLEEETINPLDSQIQIRLANLDFKNLKIDQANERVDRILEQATTLTDSLNFLSVKWFFLINSGQIKKAFKTSAEYEKKGISRSPINAMLTSTFLTKSDMYQSIGQPEKVEQLLTEINKYSPESVARYRCMANTNALGKEYKMLMDEEEYTACRKGFQSFGDGYGEYFDVLSAYRSGEFDKSLKILNSDNGRILKIFDSKSLLSKIYARAGEINKAKEELTKVIERKTDEPIYYYELAVLLEKEDKKAAKDYLDIALKYWSDADSDYIPLQRANELALRLNPI